MVIRLVAAAFAVWVGYSSVIRPLLSKATRHARRQNHRPGPNADPLQAAADRYIVVDAPDAAIALALITPSDVKQAFAGRINGKRSPQPDVNTRFEIGSISKTFTAALLVAMERQGLLQLDTTLEELVPDGKRSPSSALHSTTLENLATHCAGMPRLPWRPSMLAGLYFSPWQPYRFIRERTLMQSLRQHRFHSRAPSYRYSNLGYGVLGNLLARRSGTDYESALRRFVLQPLGLHDTGVGSTGAAADRLAQPHSASGRCVPAWHFHAMEACGGLHSTLADMLRWLQSNMAGYPPLDARLHTPCVPAKGSSCIGLGWHISGEGDSRIVWHNGGTGGSRSFMGFVPALRTGVVVLASSQVSVDALALGLLHAASRKQQQNDVVHALPKRPRHRRGTV